MQSKRFVNQTDIYILIYSCDRCREEVERNMIFVSIPKTFGDYCSISITVSQHKHLFL